MLSEDFDGLRLSDLRLTGDGDVFFYNNLASLSFLMRLGLFDFFLVIVLFDI